MAYIAPNSTIKLLTNCPLDKTYDHTIYFTNSSNQTAYFEGLVKTPTSRYTLTAQSYMYKNRKIRCEVPAGSNLYDINYIMFKNTSFENKWFYAFVTDIEYINNVTWEIGFEIDVMQTWFFDYALEQCFVEREHSATDEIGDNLVPEKLEIGEYISDGITRCADTGSATESLLEDLSLVFGCTFDRNGNDYKGGYYQGMYSGLCFIDFPFPKPATTANIQTFVTNVRNFIDMATLAGKTNGIITAFVMPTAFIGSETSTSSNIGFTKNITFNDIDGYVPKNKKLFTYPYNFMYATNFQGQTVAFPFEYFSNPSAIGFKVEGDYSPNPELVLTPLNYKGAGASGNYDEKIVLNGYPLLPFANDVFQAWLSMDAVGSLLNVLGSTVIGAGSGAIIGGATGAGVGAVPGALIGALHGISSVVSTGAEKLIAPPQAHSGAGSLCMASIRLIDFGFMHKHIRSEFAQIVDDYFSMFGYATHRCKVPNRNVRPHWTYTKTVGCCAVGSVPADDMQRICQIYDRGITFWANGNEVGNYSLNNAPI